MPRRADCTPFIKVNCTNMPVDRCEADLFGLEKGNSGQVIRRRVGSFEFANRGTIYLDGLECLPGAVIPKLLRMLRTGEIARIGSLEATRVDVQIIASALDDTVTKRGLRSQWGNLEMVEIILPPLRQRQDEISGVCLLFPRPIQSLSQSGGGALSRRDAQTCGLFVARQSA